MRRQLTRDDQLFGRFNIGREQSVFAIARHLRTQQTMRLLNAFRRAQRTMVVNPLRRREQFDAHDGRGVLRHFVQSSPRVSRVLL